MHPHNKLRRLVGLSALPWFALVVFASACAAEGGNNTRTTAVLPPDPLLGPDADADGVRDDIGEYIAAALHEEPLARQAAMQHARAERAALVAPLERGAAQAAVAASFRAVECYMFVRGKNTDIRVLKEIEARTADTDERIAAYFAHEKLLGGMTYAATRIADSASTCDFDTSSLRSAP